MGEVYRAHDSRLGRDVAIKILPSHFTADPERRSRFAREARLLATLNHPHIGAIYGLEEIDGVTALVLELLEGPTLADRLANGPLPIADALAIARQIAEALEAAHGKGIIHRDLKPANIVLQRATTASGVPSSDARAKVLDFGLAKTMVAGLDGDLAQRPAGSFDGTVEGRILGTPAYMSPEQARGRVVDKRTDIWSFACILYEMLSGRRAFDGETISDTFVSILEHQPEWTALPAATPASIRTLLERCLRKDPRTRLHDIADALIEFEDGARPVASTRSVTHAAPGMWDRMRDRLGWIVAAALALALGGTMLLTARHVVPVEPERVEFPLLPPDGFSLRQRAVEFAVSPDGQHVAFVAISKAGSSLWVRSLAAVDSRPLPGTEGARNPFWSPDSQSIGFFATNQLKTVQASGKSGVVPFPWSGSFTWPAEYAGFAPSGTWSSKDVVVFGPSSQGDLYQIDVKKRGTPAPVTKAGTTAYKPSFLPDGQHFLYISRAGAVATPYAGMTFQLRVGSLTTADAVVAERFDAIGLYAAGHVFFRRGLNLMAQSFDEESLQLEGDPLPLGVQVRRDMLLGFSVSASGRLVFVPPPTAQQQLTWRDRSGRPGETVGDPGVLGSLDLSRDGRQLAYSKVTPGPNGEAQTDIWLVDLTTGGSKRLTDDLSNDNDPVWSPDGKHIVFNSNRLGRLDLFMRASDSSGLDVPLVRSKTDNSTVASWSRADVLIFNVYNQNNRSDLWTMSLSGDRMPKLFLGSTHSELNGTFSPDGRWVAYQSNASGRDEVLVRPFPNKDPAQTISRDGGMYPRWRGDGKELFFVSTDGTMMAIGFDPASGLPKGVPRALFSTQIWMGDNRPYAVDRNGERFLLADVPDPRLIVVMDWRALVNSKEAR